MRAETDASRDTADLWMNIFLGYIALVGAMLCIFVLAAFVAQMIRRIEQSVTIDPIAIGDGLAKQVNSAKAAINKGLPRQPTTGLGRLSTADELRKWVDMRNEGLVTEEEFQKMREKLVGKS